MIWSCLVPSAQFTRYLSRKGAEVKSCMLALNFQYLSYSAMLVVLLLVPIHGGSYC